jgi:dTDP-4-amino-4,6-dideoxygalactose transaminase
MVDKVTYNPWPIGNIPEHLQRPELKQLKEKGYEFSDPREVVALFENKVAAFAGSKFAVAVDCCTHAIELSLRYLINKGELSTRSTIYIPANTYVSIYWMLKQMGFSVRFDEINWEGVYHLSPTAVVDGAVRWIKNMYVGNNSLQCLSFQIKKPIPIGRGGVILTDVKEAAEWLRLAGYDGRDLNTAYDQPGHVKMNGWHYYMTPEDAARGILLMDQIKFSGDSAGWQNYPDLRKILNI